MKMNPKFLMFLKPFKNHYKFQPTKQYFQTKIFSTHKHLQIKLTWRFQ